MKFNAHIVLREIIARQRAIRTPFTPLECFGLERLVDARTCVPSASPSTPTETTSNEI